MDPKVHCAYDEMVDITQVVPNPRNPNQHSDRQIELLAKIIEHQGWRVPITVSKRSGFVVRGHGRLMAAELLGLDKVPVDYQDYANEAEEWADLIADNRLAELSHMDNALLKDLIEEIDTGEIDLTLTGFDEDEIEELLAKLHEPIEAQEDDFDVDEALSDIKKPITKPGDVWLLGQHRVICGDSTVMTDIEKLMNGERLDMVFTDPPYNVAYEGKTKDRLTIKNDKMGDNEFYNFLYDAFTTMYSAMKEGAPIYVAHADSEGRNFRNAFHDAGFLIKQTIIWAKNAMVLGRQDYQWKHEPILYGWKPGAAHKWYGGRKQTTVWEDVGLTIRKEADGYTLTFSNEIDSISLKVPAYEVVKETTDGLTTLWRIDKPSRNAEHPTMKPVQLCARAIQNSSKEGDIVGDWFLGSGSTLIAAEQTNRRCYGIELDPVYCDVIIKRWEQFTGKKAELVNR